MPSFLLIDHSLKVVGSHHFEYARQVLMAAEAGGYDILLATHRSFEQEDSLPRSWQLLPLFPYRTYSKYSGLRASGRVRSPAFGWWSTAAPAGFVQALVQRWHRIRQRSRIRSFSAACHELWRKVALARGDQVFLPTLSDLDLVGLVEFLASEEATREVDWHLQFHFKILQGRPPEYPSQRERELRFARHFRDAIDAVPRHRLHFYSTTEETTEQFNRMGVVEFTLIPYVADLNQRDPGNSSASRRPLRITCAGNIRVEKGQRELAPIVNELWDTLFASGDAQLLIQSRHESFIALVHDVGSEAVSTGQWPQATAAPIVRVPHPLDAQDYTELIRATDIGLFLYDSRLYYGRCAGVLVEMLMGGVPVIVPAGSWLGDQIAEPIQLHLEQLRTSQVPLAHLHGSALPWVRAGSAGDWSASPSTSADLQVGSGEARVRAKFDVPAGAVDLWFGLSFAPGTGRGRYLRAELKQFDSEGSQLACSASVLGSRPGEAAVAALMHLRDRAARVELILGNAYGTDTLSIGNLEVCLLRSADGSSARHAAGAVGLAAADLDQIPELIRDLVANYSHYLASAVSFAVGWRREHDPSNALAIMHRRAKMSLSQ